MKKAVKISDMGEDKFIEKIRNLVRWNYGDDIVGIGDDCAVFPGKEGYFILLSTDSLVEGCHFIKDKISAQDLGYKAVMVNASDVAAMGGQGLYLLMAIAMPKDTEVQWLDEYMDGVEQACEEVGLKLIGGDTTGSKGGIFINFTIVGEVLQQNAKYRSGARIGDVICVTDPLGDSLAGYTLMMEGYTEGRLVDKHCRPQALYWEGKWLGEQRAVNAMMDISDGLVQDLGRMMKSSALAAKVDLAKIPMSEEFKQFASRYEKSAEEQAVESGEEYSLLLTVDPVKFDELSKAFEERFGRPLYEIGAVKKGAGLSFSRGRARVKLKSKGYLHFEQ